MRERFSRDDHSHYLFSPRHLTEWAVGLLRYDLAADPLLECWAHEARRIFEDRLVGTDAASPKKNKTQFNGPECALEGH